MPTIDVAIHAYEESFDSGLDSIVNSMEAIRNDFVEMMRRSATAYTGIMLMMMQMGITEIEITDFMAKMDAISFMPPMAVHVYPDPEGTGGKVWIKPVEAKKESDDENSDSDTLP